MKKLLTILFFVILLTCVFSETFTVNGITYAINEYSGNYFEYLQVTGKIPKGEAVVCGFPTREKNLTIPARIKYKNKTYKVKEIIYASGVSVFAYGNAINLETVKLEEGIERLGYYAFFNCKKLKKISIPATCTQIDDYALPRFDSGVSPADMACCLEEINVAKKNKRYYSIDGVLYDSKEKALLVHPYQSPIKELIIPEGIERFEGFLGGSGIIEKVILPSTLKELENTGSYFFNGCKNPPEIALPTVLRLNYGDDFFKKFGVSVIPDADRDFKEYLLGNYSYKLKSVSLSAEDFAYYCSDKFYNEIKNMDSESANTLCEAAKTGDLPSYYSLALMFKEGIVLEKNMYAYAKYIKSIAFEDFSPAYLKAALVYKEENDNWYVKRYIEEAVKQEDTEAYYYYGTWLCNGDAGLQQDIEKGEEYLKKSTKLLTF